MAYNIYAETSKKIDWVAINQKLMTYKLIEYVPMPGLGIEGGDALGISIPSKNLGNTAWEELKNVIGLLHSEYKFNLYDMYYGESIDSQLLSKIKENIAI